MSMLWLWNRHLLRFWKEEDSPGRIQGLVYQFIPSIYDASVVDEGIPVPDDEGGGRAGFYGRACWLASHPVQRYMRHGLWPNALNLRINDCCPAPDTGNAVVNRTVRFRYLSFGINTELYETYFSFFLCGATMFPCLFTNLSGTERTCGCSYGNKTACHWPKNTLNKL